MDAVIVRSDRHPEASLLAVAGLPLVLRQVQWLRAAGCDRVAVEIPPGASGDALVACLDVNPLGTHVIRVLGDGRCDARAVAGRAGLRARAVLVLAADVLGSADLDTLFRAHGDGAVVARFERPAWALADVDEASVEVLPLDAPTEPVTLTAQGVAGRVGTEQGAHRAGVAVLRGELHGQQVQATEVSPGLWLGRGARVEDGATLVGPALLGPGAVVCAGATVGPEAMLGAMVVIERGARVAGATVRDGTLVGEGLVIERCVASGAELVDFDHGGRVALDDALLLAHREVAPGVPVAPRVVAAALWALLAPAAGLAALWGGGRALRALEGRLWQVVRGRLALVGVGPLPAGADADSGLTGRALLAPQGALRIDDVLAPRDADLATQLRARAWYAYAKTPAEDLSLLRSHATAALRARG